MVLMKAIIILIGPPGSGKGTQADLLAEDEGIVHLETSKIIEEKLKDGGPDDPILIQARSDFKSGKLIDPAVVTGWVVERMRELAAQGKGIVFSGSFRTVYETEHEIPVSEELYGKENIHVLSIVLSEEESVKRNSFRRICKANRHPIPNFPEYEKITQCPEDGSEIETRVLDNPETIRVRYQTYLKETEPVLAVFARYGYQVTAINGEQPIRKVHDDIKDVLGGAHASSHQGEIGM